MTHTPPRWMVAAFWVWIVCALAAYLYQFRDIARHILDTLLHTA